MILLYKQDTLATDPADSRKYIVKKGQTMTTTIIGAETARWAGLQIDLHSKFRSGNLSADQLEWWLNQSKDARDTLMNGEKPIVKEASPSEPTEKFALLVDLGIITVPDDYDHATALKTFGKKNRKKFYYYKDAITDQNFPNPTRVLKPGDKLRVRAFKQVVGGSTTSEERMAFLATQKAVHVGAQGASLVWDQKRDQLPKGKWYCSFDEKGRLWQDADGRHWVPFVDAVSGGGFSFDLGRFEAVWRGDGAILCFCDIE